MGFNQVCAAQRPIDLGETICPAKVSKQLDDLLERVRLKPRYRVCCQAKQSRRQRMPKSAEAEMAEEHYGGPLSALLTKPPPPSAQKIVIEKTCRMLTYQTMAVG